MQLELLARLIKRNFTSQKFILKNERRTIKRARYRRLCCTNFVAYYGIRTVRLGTYIKRNEFEGNVGCVGFL